MSIELIAQLSGDVKLQWSIEVAFNTVERRSTTLFIAFHHLKFSTLNPA